MTGISDINLTGVDPGVDLGVAYHFDRDRSRGGEGVTSHPSFLHNSKLVFITENNLYE